MSETTKALTILGEYKPDEEMVWLPFVLPELSDEEIRMREFIASQIWKDWGYTVTEVELGVYRHVFTAPTSSPKERE